MITPSPIATRQSAWRWFPWVVVGAMTMVFLANALLITLATRSFPGVVTARPYETGLAYNKVLAEASAQRALGWSIAVKLADGRVSLGVNDAAGQPLEGLSVSGVLSRPLGQAETVELAFSPEDAATLAAPIGTIAPGQWDLKLILRSGEHRVATTRRLVVP